MSNQRPVFVNPLKVSLPVTALVSISHRISGIVLILLSPFFLWSLIKVAGSQQEFNAYLSCMHHPLMMLLAWGGLTAIVYHILAGLRHLVMDFGHCETLKMARFSAFLILALTVVLSVWVGIRLC